MAALGNAELASPGTSGSPVLPRLDWVALGLLLLGWLVLYLPTYQTLINTVWASDEQGHGPIIMAVALAT